MQQNKASKKKIDTSDSDSGPDDRGPLKKQKVSVEENSWDLSKNRFVNLREFKGKWYVDIREFYGIDGLGKLKPCRKGIMLTILQWQKFNSAVGDIDEAVKRNESEEEKNDTSDLNSETQAEENSWNLGSKRLVRLREYRGKWHIDIREFYDKDGELKPGKKGIMLTMEQWQKFKSVIDDIDGAVKKNASEQKNDTEDAGPLKIQAEEKSWDLSNNRFVRLREFKEKWYVDIREFYEADDELKPGRKGIMLNMELWQTFISVVDNIDEAVKKYASENKNDSSDSDVGSEDRSSKKQKMQADKNSWSLGQKRFVKLTEFKENWYIDFRVFYNSGGEMKPTRKGIMLSIEQWQKFKLLVDDIDETVKKNASEKKSDTDNRGELEVEKVQAEEKSWDLSKNCFVRLRELEKKWYVDIREYYGANGNLKPGRKGIMLNMELWRAFNSVVDDIDEAVKKDPSKKKSDTSNSDRKPSKKQKVQAEKNSWNLGQKRFVKLTELKGQWYIDIRAFYNDDGELKPGKKGIMLTIEQWQKFKSAIDDIDEAVKKNASKKKNDSSDLDKVAITEEKM